MLKKLAKPLGLFAVIWSVVFMIAAATPPALRYKLTSPGSSDTLAYDSTTQGFVNVGSVYNVKTYRAKGDDTTDDYAAVQNAINAAGNSAQGGTVFFPAGTYKILTKLTFPVTAGSQKTIRLKGDGLHHTGGSTNPIYGSILDIRAGFVRSVADGVIASRTVADGVLNSTTTVTSATAKFHTRDVGRTISATGIPGGTTIASVGATGTSAVMSAAATATAGSVSITVGGSANLSSATASFTTADVGRIVVAPGVPAATTIVSWTDAANVVLAQTATAGTTLAVSINDPKIFTSGGGYLELDGLTITDLSSGGAMNSAPLFWSTGTVLNIHDCEFCGNPSKAGATCDEPGMVIGAPGVDPAIVNTTPNSPFGGYTGTITRCYFHRVVRDIVFGSQVNHFVVTDCGNSISNGGINIESVGYGFGLSGTPNWGLIVRGNCFQENNRTYGVYCINTKSSVFYGNAHWDTPVGSTFVACHYFDPNSTHNEVKPAYWDSSFGLLIQDLSGTVRWRDSRTGTENYGVNTGTSWKLDAAGQLTAGKINFHDGLTPTSVSAAGIQYDSSTGVSCSGGYFYCLGAGNGLIVQNDGQIRGRFLIGQSATAPVLANNGTIAQTTGMSRVAPTGAVTGAIIGAGSAGMYLTVVNESAFSITFDVAGTSHVADGASDIIAANSSRTFVYDSGTSLWYPCK